MFSFLAVFIRVIRGFKEATAFLIALLLYLWYEKFLMASLVPGTFMVFLILGVLEGIKREKHYKQVNFTLSK